MLAGPTYMIYRNLGFVYQFAGVMGVSDESTIVPEGTVNGIVPESSASATIVPESVVTSVNPEE